jgi:hypothetical protein
MMAFIAFLYQQLPYEIFKQKIIITGDSRLASQTIGIEKNEIYKAFILFCRCDHYPGLRGGE